MECHVAAELVAACSVPYLLLLINKFYKHIAFALIFYWLLMPVRHTRSSEDSLWTYNTIFGGVVHFIGKLCIFVCLNSTRDIFFATY